MTTNMWSTTDDNDEGTDEQGSQTTEKEAAKETKS